MPDLMKKILPDLQKKMKTFFSITGIVSDVFPGISVAFWPTYALVFHFRKPLLIALGMEKVEPEISYPLLIIATVLGSIALWIISGWIWDPLYDYAYGPSGKFIGRGVGYQLDKFRNLTREKLALNDSTYKDPKIPIYAPVMTAVSSGDPKLNKKVTDELQVSKAFRNALLPTLFLISWSFYRHEYVLACVFLLSLLVFIAISFRYRALHSLYAYRWYVGEGKQHKEASA